MYMLLAAPLGTYQCHVTLFNVMGRIVATLAEGEHGIGKYQVVWHARDEAGRSLPSGHYYYRFIAVPENGKQMYRESGKLLLTK